MRIDLIACVGRSSCFCSRSSALRCAASARIAMEINLVDRVSGFANVTRLRTCLNGVVFASCAVSSAESRTIFIFNHVTKRENAFMNVTNDDDRIESDVACGNYSSMKSE